MSTERSSPAQPARDPDVAGAEAALHRAARRAMERAERTASIASEEPADKAGGRHGRLAYRIDIARPPTILPAVTPEEGDAVADALRTLREAGLRGSAAHLRKAAEHVNAGDWAGSVRESIHAVESVARQLDPDAAKTLGPALAALEKRGALHPALKGAFSKLYGYTSDEQGVRHALIDRPDANVGADEAVFMLGACASFASYLWRKHAAGDSG